MRNKTIKIISFPKPLYKRLPVFVTQQTFKILVHQNFSLPGVTFLMAHVDEGRMVLYPDDLILTKEMSVRSKFSS